MVNKTGVLQYDEKRGVIYFFDDKTQECILRIEGVPGVPEGHQIDVHLVHPGCEHHHEHCGNRSLVARGMSPDPGVFCAVKLEKSLLPR